MAHRKISRRCGCDDRLTMLSPTSKILLHARVVSELRLSSVKLWGALKALLRIGADRLGLPFPVEVSHKVRQLSISNRCSDSLGFQIRSCTSSSLSWASATTSVSNIKAV